MADSEVHKVPFFRCILETGKHRNSCWDNESTVETVIRPD